MKTACNTDKALPSNQPHSDDTPNPRKSNHDTQELLRRQMQQELKDMGEDEELDYEYEEDADDDDDDLDYEYEEEDWEEK